MKIFVFQFKFHWNWFPVIQSTNKPSLVRWWLITKKETSQYMYQWCSSLLTQTHIYIYIYVSPNYNELRRPAYMITLCHIAHVSMWKHQRDDGIMYAMITSPRKRGSFHCMLIKPYWNIYHILSDVLDQLILFQSRQTIFTSLWLIMFVLMTSWIKIITLYSFVLLCTITTSITDDCSKTHVLQVFILQCTKTIILANKTDDCSAKTHASHFIWDYSVASLVFFRNLCLQHLSKLVQITVH